MARISLLVPVSGLVLVASGLALLTYSSGSLASYRNMLMDVSDIGSDAAAIKDLDSEVTDDISQNDMLRNHQKVLISSGSGSKHCSCDCAGHEPQLHVQAATMLEQVGENVFFGPCASCPCMKGNSIENEVSELGADLQAAEKFETGIDKLVKEKIPVDIVMRVGQKGVNGRTGPVGFQGPDGPVGFQGPPGPTGPRG